MRNRSGNTGDRLLGRAVAAPVRVRAECVMVRSLNSLRRSTMLVSVLVAAVMLVGTGMGTVAAQDAPTEEFSKTFGGEKGEMASSVVETSDGGFALAGRTSSFGSGGDDAWLIKTDSNGNVEFKKTYGDVYEERALSVVETSDRGFAIAGKTSSYGFDDAWLIKTDSNGNVEFKKTYGGVETGFDVVRSVVETSDGGFAIAGETELSGAGNDNDEAWLIKTDSNGNVEFNETYGGGGEDLARAVVETSDGGFAIAGETGSFSAEGNDEAWLIKTDSNGNEQFNKTYRGSGNQNRASSVVETSDGGFALSGQTYSFGGGVSDALLIKTDSNGNEQFNKTYGGMGSEGARSVIETSDGSLALASETSSFGTRGYDVWLLKVSGSGNGEAGEQGLPGFTVVTAVLALLTVAAAAIRRRWA